MKKIFFMREKLKMEKMIKNLKKFGGHIDQVIKYMTFSAIGFTMCCAIMCGNTHSPINSFAYQEEKLNSGEDLLLKKSKILDDIVVYKDTINMFQATSKSSCLANLSDEKLNALKDNGYYIFISDDKTDPNQPEPVKIDGNKINVSLYSLDDDLIESINRIVA